MFYKILKSSLDGISGGESKFDGIDAVLREINYHKGWDSKEQLHLAIRRWAMHADPGCVFTTQVTAIVAVAIESGVRDDDECYECGQEGLDYEEINPTEAGLEQIVSCSACGKKWNDLFILTERREIS